MDSETLTRLLPASGRYNLHSHTQYCDGHATLKEMALAAAKSGMELWGVSPHCPILVESGANMTFESVAPYLEEADAAIELVGPDMKMLKSMEVDYLSADFGPHIDYFQKLPLDYLIGSVHFVPDQEGVPHDCDGSAERFRRYLDEYYRGDLRYVVEKYYEQVLMMMERGGFALLGHFDKIAGNAWAVEPTIEDNGWYGALVEDVVEHAVASGVLVEINTKALEQRNRFYPSPRWWGRIKERNLPVAFNSDAHWPEKVNSGRQEAMALYFGEEEKKCI